MEPQDVDVMESPDAEVTEPSSAYDDAMTVMLNSATARFEAQRRDFAERSRKLNNFLLQTTVDHTGSIRRKGRTEQVDFKRLAEIIEGEPKELTDGRWNNEDRTEP